MPVPNTNDGSARPPRLRSDISLGNVVGLPEWSAVPKGEARAVHAGILAAGFEGIQGGDVALCRELGLGVTSGGRVNRVGEALPMARQHQEAGYAATTLHVGWGLEDDATLLALVEDIVRASDATGYPIYIETHRATITQDIYRTVMLTREFPEVRFNGDFSHWYTGLEMVYGGFETKIDFAAPVFERVRFLHGRIGNPGSMQVDIGETGDGLSYVDHFREMWTRSCVGFLRTVKPGDYLSFNPELLGPGIYYARLMPQPDGSLREEGDRWQQALLYARIAKECFAVAVARVAAQG